MYLNSYCDVSVALNSLSSASLIYSNLADRYSVQMETISEIRVAKLRTLIDEYGGIKKFCEKIERSEAQVYQWLNAAPDSKSGRPRSMGNKSARYIEDKCDKPEGWMDQCIQELSGDNHKTRKIEEPSSIDYITDNERLLIRGYRVADNQAKSFMLYFAKEQIDKASKSSKNKVASS